MTNLYTQTQAFELAKKAGFDNKNAEIAAAIAMAETLNFKDGKQYCDFDQVGDVSLADHKWGPSYGAWQVRSLIRDYGTGRTRDASKLHIPEFNAASAYRIWKDAGERFTPWSTFTSDAYKGYLQAPKHNPKPVVPAGTYMVTGGDTLSKIGQKTGFSWRLVAALNHLVSPYTIFPGQVLNLPDWEYTIQSGDTLSKIAQHYASVTWQRIAEYNEIKNPNVISVGQKVKIPRYVSWDGKTLIR